MTAKSEENLILVGVVVVWIVSFFLPSLKGYPDWPGYKAALGSIVGFVSICIALPRLSLSHLVEEKISLLYGLLWIANVFMLASPWLLLRVRRGKGKAGIALLAVWDVLILVTPWVPPEKGAKPWEDHTFLIGYFVWQGTVLAMTVSLYLLRCNYKKTAVPPCRTEPSV